MALIFNQCEAKELRRGLRKQQTETEGLLWSQLRDSKLGIKFRRQFGIGPFVVDFYAPRARLVIEVDGSIHDLFENRVNDMERQADIEVLGLTFLRFTSQEIQGNMESVLRRIQQHLQPSPCEGEGTSEARG